MITKDTNTKLSQSQEFTSYSFGIKESGLSHIFNVLRNQLYSDKILAVIREYSANALDAHAEVGKQDTPIEVTVPSQLNLNFEVRDFGRGLTEKEIGEIYAMYGESTKRGTNEQIGQLGLGSKSGFAYGDNFLITSWTKGKKVVYNAFIDPSQVGRIAKMQEEKSDEPCGIKITIPVKQADISSFQNKALQLFSLFQVFPILHGVSKDQIDEAFAPKNIIFEAKDQSWRLTEDGDGNRFYAIMGNIPYPINQSALNFSYDTDEYNFLHYLRGIIKFPIGALEVAANREDLQYTDATIAAIKSKIAEIIQELPVVFNDRINTAETLWEAKHVFAKMSRPYFSYASRFLKKIIEGKNVKWRGIPVDNIMFSFKDSKYAKDIFGFRCDIFGKPHLLNRNGKRIKRESSDDIMARIKDRVLIIEDDIHKSSGVMNRIAPLLTEYAGRPTDMPMYDVVYLVDWGDKKDEIIKQLHFDAETKLLSSFEHVKLNVIYPPTATVKISTGSSNQRKKHQSKEFKLNFDKKGNYSDARSSWFTETLVDTDDVTDGVYVELDRFYIKQDETTASPFSPREVVMLVNNIKSLTGCKLPDVYGFKLPQKVKGNDNWIDLFSWLTNILKQYFVSIKFDQILCNYHHLRKHISHVSNLNFEIVKSFYDADQPELNLVAPHSVMQKYLNAVKDMCVAKNDHNVKLLEGLNTIITENDWGCKINIKDCFDNKPTHDLNKVADDCIELYPMITLLNSYRRREVFNKIPAYINLVDITCSNK